MNLTILLRFFSCTGTPKGSDMNIKEALECLMKGNERYVNDKSIHPNRCKERRKIIAEKQEPYAVIVGCSDSRASPEIIFDEGLGDLFVVRVAGNVIGPVELDSIEYSAIYLHSKIILVMGHENCGAIDAVINNNTADIEAVARLIEPSVEEARQSDPNNLFEEAIKTNALNMKNYLENSPVIKKLINENKLEVHAGYLHIKTGLVELLGK